MESPAPTITSSTSEAPAITPLRTMRGHTDCVKGVVHLPSGRRIITCSVDRSLRLWDLESGTQIGEDWRDENNGEVWSMSLSPNGETVASGNSATVILWDVETRKVIAKWTGHTHLVCALCWSADSKRVASGSWDGTARVWDVKSGETVLTITTGHKWVNAVVYSPDNEHIATGGDEESAVKIWDSKAGKLITTLKQDYPVWRLAWTSDGKKLISGSYGPIRIFDTATWQHIAIFDVHIGSVNALSLSANNRFLARAFSFDKTVGLWNLDTNLPIGPPLQYEDLLASAAFSADGKTLVTGCQGGNVCAWDIHAILKEAGLEDLLPVPDVIELIDTDATQGKDDELPPDFFDGVRDGVHSSTAYSNQYRSSAHHRPITRSSGNMLLRGLLTFFRRSPSNINQATELQQRPRRSIFSHSSPRVVEVAAVRDKQALYVAPPQAKKTQAQPQGQAQSSSSQSQPAAASTSTAPPAPAPTPAPDTTTAIPVAATVRTNILRFLARLVLFLCCAYPPQADGH